MQEKKIELSDTFVENSKGNFSQLDREQFMVWTIANVIVLFIFPSYLLDIHSY